MSTVVSPQTSLSIRSPSTSNSTRTSLDLPANANASSATTAARAPPAQIQRRNRAALREFYGLKNAPTPASATGESAENEGGSEELSELDREGFDAEGYVKGILEREGLEGVLRVESGLINEIRGLDGERKALVYDNYSKLIAATDTIRKMRTNMDPLTPATSTLSPAISHIAETASALSSSLAERAGPIANSESAANSAAEDKERQKQTVRWVLDAPQRIRILVSDEKPDAARAEWEEVHPLLDKWNGVQGVEELKRECEQILKGNQAD
ncbi:hypothetical protein LTS18_003474 [Coniosporium uncinatum]|uniref:Uncharacterized protein n=1 Tax=Coniosporium uncinatum TaxID=93489 RepID=A0ACC3D723_9PEZI|nr:hypothetical protein LTS18_003474 [Coniosporium uncinatum]